MGDAAFLRDVARGLSYNNGAHEASAKHHLLEIEARIRNGAYK